MLHRLPTYFLSHGGGPWPWMKDYRPGVYDQLEESLKSVRRELGEAPRAVLMISGHWESDRFWLSSAAHPPMYYDYSGFPEHTYRIRYDAPGDPELAELIRDLLQQGGQPTGLDPHRGFDHGTFSLMHTLYREGELPLVQLSMKADFDPAEHIRVGELLAPLRDQGVLIIGSGFSFHDTRSIINGAGQQSTAKFDGWLGETLTSSSPQERRRRLIDWVNAPSARAARPREDHLIPLMVALGAAGDDRGHRVYHESAFMGSITASSYRFGDPVICTPHSETALQTEIQRS
ncbi:class III extradiol ring-cleavage dioxygenase [Caballeronia sp. LZ043]|uniref:DODA-type extradiol aromatic ring-opening family dioxygenase n=1 Tax=Caballeronia sp. LZ043 TaxID=3038569 RepID=UPI00286430DD|nr:class III extradiol ring-cleavage dioxygenase [Caballeronia sp. LZ043]MDR5822354.1 class III extradiol ring-cleavage dioxygenase [Caballeronia sp. LZ043]